MAGTARQARLSADARLLIAGQGVRAAAYGFTSVGLGALMADRGYGAGQAGLVLAAVIAGTAVSSLLVGALADRVGRRRSYGVFFMGLACAGAVVAAGAPYWALVLVGLSGTLSTDVVDNGPATTLEQVMLAAEDAGTARVYGRYNAVGSACGALGALAVSLVAWSGGGGPRAAWFFALVPTGLCGMVLAGRLSQGAESLDRSSRTARLGPSRGAVRRLAALFAVDAGAGGLVSTGFLAYFLTQRHHVGAGTLGWLFMAVALVQAVSVALAPRLAARYGLVATMVGTHLPSNVLLAAVAFAPTFGVAAVLLLARTSLSQMDVPTRQALVMSVVQPTERIAAAAVTNAARYTVRPFGPLVAGAAQQLALGAPLVIAGAVKAGYDLALWRWARHRSLTDAGRRPTPVAAP